jgi:hypothetical protein
VYRGGRTATARNHLLRRRAGDLLHDRVGEGFDARIGAQGEPFCVGGPAFINNDASVYVDHRVLFPAARHIAFTWQDIAYVHRHSQAPSQFGYVRHEPSIETETDGLFAPHI